MQHGLEMFTLHFNHPMWLQLITNRDYIKFCTYVDGTYKFKITEKFVEDYMQ